jgi:hypothetical protein
MRLIDGSVISLSWIEMGNRWFRLGMRSAVIGIDALHLSSKEEAKYWQCGPAFRIGWWTHMSRIYGNGLSIPFTEAEIRAALLPGREKSESD